MMPGISARPAGIDDLGTVLADLADRRDAAVPDCDLGSARAH
jgi:hypothetical protein